MLAIGLSIPVRPQGNKAQQTVNHNGDGHDPQINALLTWMNSNGVQTSAVRISRAQECDGEDSRRGLVVADLPLRAGENVVTIPRSLLISTDDCFHALQEVADETLVPALSHGLLNSIRTFDPLSLIAAAISLGKPQSFRPFFDSLPRDMGHLPINWPKDRIDLLVGVPLHTEVVESIENLHYLYKGLSETGILGNGTNQVSSASYFSAYSNVLARAYSLNVGSNGTGYQACLVPFADMMNEGLRKDKEVRWAYDSQAHYFSVDANEAIGPGEEVITTYGLSKGPARYLFLYGFVPQEFFPPGFQRDPDMHYTDVLQSIHAADEQKMDSVLKMGHMVYTDDGDQWLLPTVSHNSTLHESSSAVAMPV